MVRHIVMWKLVPSPDMAERAMDIKENLEGLKDKIDLIVDIEVGININTADTVSDIVLVSTFNSVEELNEYQNHPAHKAVGAHYVKPYVEERRVCDYEF
ncbi:MAG: Dabb family protein [Clostridia bacterium]|nr:Dabb family protein [Clostridia bacterium]